MSTFYLLPPRPFLGKRLAEFLKSLLPGVDAAHADPAELAELLTHSLARRAEVFVVCREDLPAGEDASAALQDGFGAEPGDEVIEVRPGLQPGEMTCRRWQLEPRTIP